MMRFFQRRRRNQSSVTPSKGLRGNGQTDSVSLASDDCLPPTLVQEAAVQNENSYPYGFESYPENTSDVALIDFDGLLEIITDVDISTSRFTLISGDKSSCSRNSAKSVQRHRSISDESADTIPTGNKLTNMTDLLSGFVYLSLLPLQTEQDKTSTSKDQIPVALKSPRDTVISSIVAHFQLHVPAEEIHDRRKRKWAKTVPVCVDDYLLVVEDTARLAAADDTLRGTILGGEYRQALEKYESLRRDFERRSAHSDSLRPLLSRLAIVSLLGGYRKRADAYCSKLIDYSDTNKSDFLQSLILRGLVQYGFERLNDALISWREASYYVGSDSASACLLWNNLACLHLHRGMKGDAIECIKQSMAIQKQCQDEGEGMNHALLNSSIIGGNGAMIAEISMDYKYAHATLQEILILQESIWDRDTHFVLATRQNLDRLADVLLNSNKAQNPIATYAEERHTPFKKCDDIALPRAVLEVAAREDFIQLGSFVNDLSPAEIIYESFIQPFMLPQNIFSRKPCYVQPLQIKSVNASGTEVNLQTTHDRVLELLTKNEVSQALGLLKCCLKSHRNRFGIMHPLIALTLHNIGIILLLANRFDDAFIYFQNALRIGIKTLGSDHADVCDSLIKLGLIFFSQRQFDKALAIFSRVLLSRRRALGYNHPQISKLLNNIGCIHLQCGGLVAASKSMEEAIDILRRSGLTDRSSKIAASITLCNHGFILSRLGIDSYALTAYQEAYDIQKSIYPMHSNVLKATMENLKMALTKHRQSLEEKSIFGLLQFSQCAISCH